MEIDIFSTLQSNPILLFFVTLGLGFFVGRLNLRGITLGSSVGVIITGLCLGHLGLSLPPTEWGSVGFAIFIYAVGVSAGPRFFDILRGSALKYLSLAAVTALTAGLLAYQLSSWMQLEEGMAAGMLAGALTSTPTLVAAQDAIQAGLADLPSGVKPQTALRNLSVSYALTYGFGTIGVMLLIRLLPRFTKLDLQQQALLVEQGMGLARSASGAVGETTALVQAYQIRSEDFTGKSLKELDLGAKHKFTVGRVKRGDEVFDAEAATTLQPGDKVSVLASFDVHQVIPDLLGPRIQDRDLLDTHVDSCEVVVTNEAAVNRKLGDLHLMGERGFWVTRVLRSQIELPLQPSTVIQRGDVMYLTGIRGSLRQLARGLGQIEAEIHETDIPTFAMGIAIGLLLGDISVKFGNINLTLGTAGGLLLVGIAIGFLRSLNPTFGRVPEAARWVLQELGLLFFLAGVGLTAGGQIQGAFLSVGPGLLLSGAIVTIVPPLVAYAFGLWALRLNPAVLLGGICGAMTSTSALSLVSAEAKSEVPALGYAGAYAFANVMLTFAGSLMMRI